MNKRKYPYGIDMCPQLKIHIGEKQVANGVLGPSKMSEIYEKTKQILFQRAKASFEAIDQSVVVDKVPCDSKPSKQMQLTFDGQLCKPDVLFVNSKVNNYNQKKCNFCSKTEKLDICGKCGEIFCNMCSFSLFCDEANKMCLTCYQ
ncbi:PREDICTED: apoptosis regulatory protein Siva-like isoform X3 [Diuraphis noxia]|nr:PREDICTED: apoptosis regulatory protein Siva-like isoform X3 [Diuraphis noxia]XP_015365695.1 PREDICTED: apoptosis regulatory protein Siva-like isoform X3 [Diuraphis noxia]XP_015365696.1 PREDICTED: apoptosis regulatory protein Siva-like isoform X3 [Diuraphis noxia]